MLRKYYLCIRPILTAAFRGVINTVIIVFHVRTHTGIPSVSLQTPVYVPSGRSTAYLALLSMYSFNRHIPGLRYILLDSGDITKIQKWMFRHIGVHVEIIGVGDVNVIRAKLKKYPSLLQYFDYGWSGRKFFVPLLSDDSDAFILLDVDILTFAVPHVVKKWIYAKKDKSLYMEDYKNFSVLSNIEMNYTLKKQLQHTRVNTGFLCVNHKKILQTIPLKRLNLFMEQVHSIVSDRILRDLKTKNPLDYIYPMIEQTLYWYIFEHTKSQSLSATEFVIFPRHLMNHFPLINPVMIHFSGEADKESEYKYIWMSLLSWLKKRTDPWYAQSPWYCMDCRKNNNV